TGRAGLTLEGDATQQSRLLFANRTGRALHIANCSNLKVRDLVLEYSAPSWTQGQLKGWDTSPLHNWIDILVSPGYESPTSPNDVLYQYASALSAYEPVGGGLRWNFDQFYIRVNSDPLPGPPFEPSPAPGGYLRVHLVNAFDSIAIDPTNPDRMQNDDLIVVKGGICHGIQVENSSDTTFQHVTARRAPCFTFFDVGCTRSTYDGCVVDPIGKDIVSSGADGQS